MKVLTIAPGHRYVNDYYQYYRDNKPNDFVLLGQYNEFDLYALKQLHQWSLGARWSNEGSEYQSGSYIDTLERLNVIMAAGGHGYTVKEIGVAAVRLYAFLTNQAKAFHGCIVGPIADTCLSFTSQGGNVERNNPRIWGITYPGTDVPDIVLRYYLEGNSDISNYFALGSNSSNSVGLFACEKKNSSFILGYSNDYGSSISTIEGRSIAALDASAELWEEAYQAYGAGKYLTYPVFQFEIPSSGLSIPPEGRYENEQYRICRDVHTLNKFCWIGQWEEFDLYAVKKADGYWHAYARNSFTDTITAPCHYFDDATPTKLSVMLEDRRCQLMHRVIDNPLFQALVKGVDLITFEPDPNYVYQDPRSQDIKVYEAGFGAWDKFASEERNIPPLKSWQDLADERATPAPFNLKAMRSHAVSMITKEHVVFSVVMDRINESERIIVTDTEGREYQIDINLIK